MKPDWRSLAPHLPIAPGETNYVERPDRASARIAEAVLAGRSPVLVAGPAGVGKSTELAHLAAALGAERTVELIQLDRALNMRVATGHDVLAVLAVRFSIEVEMYRMAGGGSIELFDRPDAAIADDITKVLRQAGPRQLLAIDGIEKCPPQVSAELFETLARFCDDADFVVVVPWHAAYGPDAQQVMHPNEKFIAMRPLPDTDETAEFFAQVLGARLGLSAADSRLHMLESRGTWSGVVRAAALLSGGIPRTLLQLMADAGSRAQTSRGEPWPTPEDLNEAAQDQTDSLRRLLLPGDVAAIRGIDGSDGRELDLSRKLRLLNHGLVLESVENGRATLRAHPLLRPLLKGIQ